MLEYQQHSAPLSLIFGSQICDKNCTRTRHIALVEKSWRSVQREMFRNFIFKILLRVRCVEYEHNLHFKPGMSQHRWLSLVVNRGIWYIETYWWQDKGAREWLFSPQILSLEYSDVLSLVLVLQLSRRR